MTISNYKKNFLKDLIYLSHTKPVSKKIIKGLFRFALEPLLESQNQKAVVLLRLFDTAESEGILKRLEFTNAEVYSFSKNVKGENLEKEPIWEDTEFLVILSPRYSVALLWDYSTEEIKDTSCVYYLVNSRDVNNVIRIISANSHIDLNRYTMEFTPERRSNELVNKSVHKFIDFAANLAQEADMSQVQNNLLEANEELLKKYGYISEKAKMISHEIKNHLSVIDLYSKILEKRVEKLKESEDKTSITNALSCICKSKDSITQLLSELKTIKAAELKPVEINNLLSYAELLAAPKAKETGAKLIIENKAKGSILADENKLTNVLINLIYNSLDAVKELKTKGEIRIIAQENDPNMLKISVCDNGTGIKEEHKEKIFEKGFSSKVSGTGLGLYISKEAMKEQFGDLELVESSQKGTTMELTIAKV